MKQNYDIAHIFGCNLRRLRNQRNISQLELALRTGRTQTFMNQIENGEKWVSAATISKICQALEVFPYQLFTTDDMPEADTLYEKFQRNNDTLLAIQDKINRYIQESQ